MNDITINLSDHEIKALETEMISVESWLENAIKNRTRISTIDITQKLMSYCNDNEIAIAVGEEAQIDQAYELGVAKKASDIDFTEPEEIPS